MAIPRQLFYEKPKLRLGSPEKHERERTLLVPLLVKLDMR